jgi:hypothetical protein
MSKLPPPAPQTVKTLYGSTALVASTIGKCKLHKYYLTIPQLELHNCLSKQCRHLIKFEERSFWQERARKLELKKAKRKREKDILEIRRIITPVLFGSYSVKKGVSNQNYMNKIDNFYDRKEQTYQLGAILKET